MARSATVFARVEPEVKENAEEVLSKLGIPMSNAVDMFLRQVVIQGGIPFALTSRPRTGVPVAHASLSEAEFRDELQKGLDSIAAGRTATADEVDAAMSALRASVSTIGR
ncbi:type II toxin-antitoxin system RelB/DinJ family antitoxin [Arcanobacterium hippocoleae]|uniref:Addiction module RelB/DinJ family antitoxin n=1 Tax=Arcanobacterium hippocoleae TaxID=149017 RepID=A0ABU1T3V3_9ACTO|nr:type II toxin-antitoxin system RelB/DinJ family antitoxin [Arcanobacterium hippocoleae]MDR6939905.1 addiction module RelB/DinJ family antitoxin [Arcanobacterium hippocoleae]